MLHSPTDRRITQGKFRQAGKHVASACLFLVALLAVPSCQKAEPPAQASPAHAVALFTALFSPELPADTQDLIAASGRATRADPNWPTLAYLAGELHLRGKDPSRARSAFRELCQWAASSAPLGPYEDGWGGSGLAAVALWRWLQLLDSQGGTAEEITEVLAIARSLYNKRLFVGMVHPGLLPSLPLVEEDSARRLAHVLWKAGRPEASSVFLAFLTIDSVGAREKLDDEIAAHMLERGLATPERLELFRYRRQLGLTTIDQNKQRAADALHQLWRNPRAPSDVRAEAVLEWATFHRRSGERKPAVIAGLTDAYDIMGGTGRIAEQALLQRGQVQNSVSPRDPASFYADLTRLVAEHPASPASAEALYQMATERIYSNPPDIDAGLAHLSDLRKLSIEHDRHDSAYFVAAAALIDRAGPSDLDTADKLLAEYLVKFPDGPFRLRSMFWRGRVAAMLDRPRDAQPLFESLVAQAPFDYYGVRASMHLDDGEQAASQVMPRPGSKTWHRLRETYGRSVAYDSLDGATPYHARLKAAESTGQYAQLLEIVGSIGSRFRNRLDNIALEELDRHRLVPAAALLLSLRQDALAARDADQSAANRLRLAAFLGRRAGDWTTAFTMSQLRQDAPRDRLAALQNDPRFLATAYPRTFTLPALKGATREFAWPIDGSVTLSESLMYAVIRNESGFYPGALSSVGAIGLFQIMPRNFERTPACWQDISPPATPTAASYLFNPRRNVQFWACWTDKEKLRPTTSTDIPEMLIKHNAGTGNLNLWKAAWQGRRLEHDLELQIDSLRFPATQLFVRHVLADLAIAYASGVDETRSEGTPRELP